MKRFVVTLLIATLLCGVTSAFAAGKINVEKENCIALNNYRDYAYGYAKVKNVGNKMIKINAGILEVFDAEGDVITSTDSLRKYAEYLEPDEYTYVYLYAQLEEGQMEQIDDYLLTITGKSDAGYVTKRLTVKDFDFQRDVKSGYSTYDYAYFTVVNNTNEVVWGVDIVYALLDGDDNILYVGSGGLDSNEGLAPGSSILFKERIDSDFMSYYDAHNLIPSKVDAIAYVNIEAK